MAKPVYILGISGLYHDSAAVLLKDGVIAAAAQEERFTRKKHDSRLPQSAIAYCLGACGISQEAIDYVVFYEKPLLKFDRILETYFAFAPRGFKVFLMGIPQWLKEKLHIPRELDRVLGNRFKGKYIFTEHHESHAASAFFPSPYSEAAIVTLDGVGEWTTASIGIGRGNQVELQYELRFPHSLGLLYSAFTYFTGFKVNSGEYKLMGLAPYGQPIYADLIRENLLDLKEDGSFRLNMDYFTYGHTDSMTGAKFEALFGGPRRRSESPVTQREMDLAASIQQVTEEIMLRIVRFAYAKTGCKNLVLAGGVALNCVGNGRILREGPFENMWIQPAAGDAGGALGAALFVHYQLLKRERTPNGRIDEQLGSLLGPAFSSEEIGQWLDEQGLPYHYFEDETMLLERAAGDLNKGLVVGWFQGKMEFGPRALGCRSILGDARNEHMQSRMNLKIKFRESFRPFAPSVLKEKASEYFVIPPTTESPYMLLVAPVREEKRLKVERSGPALTGIDLLKEKRSVVPGITHVDYSARIQTVDRERHGRYYRLLKVFESLTGCPLIINTSFNVRGEPIVCTPQDALHCFRSTQMDALVLGDYILYREELPAAETNETEHYLRRFELD